MPELFKMGSKTFTTYIVYFFFTNCSSLRYEMPCMSTEHCFRNYYVHCMLILFQTNMMCIEHSHTTIRACNLVPPIVLSTQPLCINQPYTPGSLHSILLQSCTCLWKNDNAIEHVSNVSTTCTCGSILLLVQCGVFLS